MPTGAVERRNTAVLVANFVLSRIGWIFKTESVIVPAFIDAVSGAGWVRGLLPVINRLAQSLPPFLLARRIKLVPRKRNVLFLANIGMALPFGAIAVVLFMLGPDASPIWMVPFFLILYGVFYMFTGITGLSSGTLQGKLIGADRRGRLMALASVTGALIASASAWVLLPAWLEMPGTAGYARAFACTALFLFLAGLFVPLLVESEDAYEEPGRGLTQLGRDAVTLLGRDRDFRRVVIAYSLFVSSIALLPHYQSLGRERLDLGGGDLMTWVVVQNLALAAVSAIAGPLVDRMGNRLGLRLAIFISAAVPLLALVITGLEPEIGRRLFVGVFVGIGLTPVVIRIQTNYLLEIAPASDHPRYLALSQLCSSLVMLGSPFLGAAVDWVGYTPVFCGVSVLVATGGALTFGIREPRFAKP